MKILFYLELHMNINLVVCFLNSGFFGESQLGLNNKVTAISFH